MSFLRLLLVLCLASGLTACEPATRDGGGSQGTRLQEIIERGELRVGLSGNQPPLNMRNRAGEVIGLEVDLTTELAHSMGLEVRLVAGVDQKVAELGQRDEIVGNHTDKPAKFCDTRL